MYFSSVNLSFGNRARINFGQGTEFYNIGSVQKIYFLEIMLELCSGDRWMNFAFNCYYFSEFIRELCPENTEFVF